MVSEHEFREELARILGRPIQPGSPEAKALEVFERRFNEELAKLGPASDLAAGSHQPVVQQPRAEHNSPETGDVEGLAERLENIWNARDEGEIAFPAWVREAADDARATVMTLSRLLQERSDFLDAERARFDAIHDALEARAETAERLLGEVVGTLEPFAKIADHLTPGAYGPAWGFNGGVIEHEDFRRARETLSKVSKEGFSSSQGSVGGPGCVPAANRPHQPSAEGAVSQEGR